jgi:hypothetical protein
MVVLTKGHRVLCEQPRFSQRIALFARQGGEYIRPIIGDMVDIRVEDMIPTDILRSRKLFNTIGKFPDVPEAGQHNCYFVATYGSFDRFENDPLKIEQLVTTGQYLYLPDNADSEFWQYTQAPWWEFCEVLDEHGNPIKAPLRTRSTDYKPEDIDERLDEFDENRGKLGVLSPLTLEKMVVGAIRESYLERLNRILSFGG